MRLHAFPCFLKFLWYTFIRTENTPNTRLSYDSILRKRQKGAKMGKAKRKYYLIDTENVGDRWLGLPGKLKRKEKIITFYTENHSKHMEKFFMDHAHNPKIQWLECAAGSNALDYQLIGVLSYLIAQHPKAAFCIFSNDKGYQATVDFWKSHSIDITQKIYEVKDKKKSKKKKGKKKKANEGKNMAARAPSAAGAPGATRPEEQYALEVARSLPASDLNSWYNVMTMLLGQEAGREWYRTFRQDAQLRKRLSQYCVGDSNTRSVKLVETIFRRFGFDVSHAKASYEIIQSHGFKNLSAIKVGFDKKFGAQKA